MAREAEELAGTAVDRGVQQHTAPDEDSALDNGSTSQYDEGAMSFVPPRFPWVCGGNREPLRLYAWTQGFFWGACTVVVSRIPLPIDEDGGVPKGPDFFHLWNGVLGTSFSGGVLAEPLSSCTVLYTYWLMVISDASKHLL